MPKKYPFCTDSVSLLAGGPGRSLFKTPASVASDGAGFVWVSDFDNHQIKIFSAVNSTVIATIGSGSAGFQDGSFATAQFNHPNGIALGPDGTLYVADMNNNRIRAIDLANGTVSTFAGAGVAGFNDGTPAVAKFNQPSGIAVDANGTVYVADQGNNMIRRIIHKNSVTLYAGQLHAGSADATGSLASFNGPRGIAVAPNGAVYVADMLNNKIRKIVSGTVTTLAGNGAATLKDGAPTAASFDLPSALATDSAGNVYVADQFNIAVRMVTPTGVVTTVAGGQSHGTSNGTGANIQFQSPNGITVDPKGDIYITDQLEPAVRKLIFTPVVKTLAGRGGAGYFEGTGKGSLFDQPMSTAVGPDGSIYVVDNTATGHGALIRKITPDGRTSFVGGYMIAGFRDGPVSQAQFRSKAAVAVAPDGTIYVADMLNNRIRKIADGVVSTLAGNGNGLDIDGTGTDASFNAPSAIAVDASGMIYVATEGTGRLCKITPAGVVTTVSIIRSALLSSFGLAIDSQGHKFVCGRTAIYEIATDNQPAIVYYGGLSAGGTPNVPDFAPTGGLAVDASGNLYVSEQGEISVITPNRARMILAGNRIAGNFDGPNLRAMFSTQPAGLAFGSTGILYIADKLNNEIRMMGKL